MTKFFTLLLFGFTAICFSQGTGSIVGALTDKDYNNEPLAFANVFINGSTKGTTSDFDGLYAIEDLPVGTYSVVYSFVGYETVTIDDILVETNKATTMNVPMGASAAALDEVFIKSTTRKESEVSLLREQKNATAIKQSIGAEELARKGVSDAAGAIAKISGVSKQEGGGNVYVRGLGDRYQNTTYNGLSLPSNDIERKNIDLSLFSSDIIQNVSVSKAYDAQFYGDFAAGNVNVTSKDYSGKFFMDIQAGSGINTTASGKAFVKSEGTSFFGYYNRYDNNPFAVILSHGLDPVDAYDPIAFNGAITGGTSFEFKNNSRLSLFFTGSFSNNFEYREGEATEFSTVEKKSFPKAEEYEYGTNTTGMVNLVYKINNDHKVSFNSLFVNDATDEVGYFGIGGGGRNRDAILDTDKGFYQMNVQFTQDMIFVNQLTGSHRVDDKFKVDWGAGYNKVFARQPDRKRITLERYDLALDGDPNTNPSFFNNINFDNQRYFQNIEDEELNSRINLEYTASEKLKFNFGYNGRTKERYFDNIRYGYEIIEPNTPVTDVNNFNDVFTVENLGVVYNTFVFNPIWPEGGIDNTNYPGLSENTYIGNLDVHAAYVNAEIALGDKLLIVPGFRAESVTQSIKYDVINLTETDPGFRDSYENFFLPSLNVRYALNEEQNLRFSASNTVSIPEFKEVAPFVYEDVSNRVGGNPDLLSDPSFSKIYNIDLKYEWFYGKSELLSLAAFGKQINDPINRVIANDATGTQRYFRSGDKAEVLGVEFEVKKNIMVDEYSQPVLAVGFNATYTYTKQDLKSSEGIYSTTFEDGRTEELQGAAPVIVNADISYSPTFGNYKPTLNAVFSYFSDRIDAIGSGQLGNIVEKGVPTLNFVFKNDIGDNFEVNATAFNLLNPNIQYVRETDNGDIFVTSPNGKGIASYRRGINLSLQLKYKF